MTSKLAFLLILMGTIGFGSLSVFAKESITPADQVCARYKSQKNSVRSASLRNVRQALNIKKSMGLSAKNATGPLEKLGFHDLLKEKPQLLKDLSLIPEGAVIVLDKTRAANCPVNEKHGHIVIKCAGNSITWAPGKVRNLNVLKSNPDCIRSVMYYSGWEKKKAKIPVPTPKPSSKGSR